MLICEGSLPLFSPSTKYMASYIYCNIYGDGLTGEAWPFFRQRRGLVASAELSGGWFKMAQYNIVSQSVSLKRVMANAVSVENTIFILTHSLSWMESGALPHSAEAALARGKKEW